MKNFFLILYFSTASLCLKAQDDSTSNFGIKGGYNLAAASYDGDTKTGQRHGFHLGVYGEFFINQDFAIQLELLYSQQGYEIEGRSGTFTQKLNYINLPFMFKAYPSKNFFLEAGPQIGLAISHKEEFDSSFGLFDTSSEFDPSSFDWGVNFGGGFKTNSGVSLGVRYHLGLGDIYDEGAPRNRVWMFFLGVDL